MFMRVDKLQAELPPPKRKDPNAAAALQELLGGKYGEMSTLGNYMFQSFNFRSKSKLRPFYSLVASITAEELGHVELVTNGIALLNQGPPELAPKEHPAEGPYAFMRNMRDVAAYTTGGGAGLPFDSDMRPWTGMNVFHTGNLVLDLLHNFFLECGARMHKLRTYEQQTDPVGREVLGYLLVRGSVHAQAFALALKKLTGVEMEKMLPVPNITHDGIPEAAKYEVEGRHRHLYTFGEDAYADLAGIWSPDETTYDKTGPLEVVDMPPEGGNIKEMAGSASSFTPDYAPEEIFEIANKLYNKAKG